ncbi:alpha-2-HS-glycoprotein 2 [Denticeps clupeoides]|uniref:alpha-2-HS-glycoprotein 2 n=1 Tax=Denticeps clupeoides TaxID=299321 RepID=UPI0010A3C5CE|nr:alpha-2-HS-glycoprotein [Denticeps clupeoides]
MKILCVVLGLLVAVAWAQKQPKGVQAPCDSPEAEKAALFSQDFLNAQHTHGYKYTLNQIDDFKIATRPDGVETYFIELELLETKCHVLDPTPVANCTVRTKAESAVEADCDVALSNAAGVLSVVAFKCGSEIETVDGCVGCINLLPLNHTDALIVTSASLASFNNQTGNATTSKFSLLEVGRLSSQVLAGGPRLFAEYAIVETNCTTDEDDNCVPLNNTVAAGINATAPTPVFLHQYHAASPQLSPVHGIKLHKLTAMHDPTVSNLLSAESESSEAMPPAAAIVKREAVADPILPEAPALLAPPKPLCPGRLIYF